MRLWSLHPKYLDAAGLVAVWREALLAREVIRGRTVGYRAHPQLQRFRECAAPRSAVNAYLVAVHAEAVARGYAFKSSKLGRVATKCQLAVSQGQLDYEWRWLLHKLRRRDPARHRTNKSVPVPEPHPLFVVTAGPICPWERVPERIAVQRQSTMRKDRIR